MQKPLRAVTYTFSSPDAIVTVVEPPPRTMMRNSAPPRRDVTTIGSVRSSVSLH